MAIGRAERRAGRHVLIAPAFPAEQVEAALDLIELLDLAWHDCYGEAAPPQSVIDDVLTVAHGDLRELVQTARLAVIDWRDLRLAADSIRRRGQPGPSLR